MRINTGGRYGLRVMLDLALHIRSQPVLRQDIASRQGISPEYIAQLFRSLSKAGLAEGVMGPGGGYHLDLTPDQIRVGDIFRAVEGPIAAVYCVTPEGGKTCVRSSTCASRLLWVRMSLVIENFLDSITLENLCAVARQLENPDHSAGEDAVARLLLSVDSLSPAGESCLTHSKTNDPAISDIC